ncbi:MAG TPA: tetratricopeptide repeat protein [Pseudomonadales bacterium]|nr:tetratricopeptide repeat protein [Pseudomonadales bacterium]
MFAHSDHSSADSTTDCSTISEAFAHHISQTPLIFPQPAIIHPSPTLSHPVPRGLRGGFGLILLILLLIGCQEPQPADPATQIDTARQKWQEGEVDAARNLLQQLLTRYPRLSPARTLLGRIELAQGNLDRAEHHLRHDLGCVDDGDQARLAYAELLRARGDLQQLSLLLAADLLSPAADNSARHHFLLAEVASGRGDWASALDHYRRAIQIDPRMSEAQLGLLRTLIRQGQDAEALQQITLLLNEPAAPAELFELRAEIEARQGRLETAVQSLEMAIALAPNRAEARIAHARLRLRMRQPDLARQEIAVLLKQMPDSIAVRLLDADLHEQLGDRDGTISRLREIFLLDQNQSDALGRLGTLLYQRQRWREAEIYLDRWLTLSQRGSTDEVAIRQMLARSQLQLRNLTAAEKNLLWLRTHGGGDASEVDLVKLYLLGGRTSEGVSLATALTERLPQNDAPLANQLAELLLQQNQTQPALKLLSRITSTQPQTPPPTRLLLIRTLIASQDLDRARRELESWHQRDTASALAWQAAGEVAAARGQWPEAQSAWQHAKAIDDSDPRLWLDIATAARMQNRADEGRRLLDEALVRFPDQLELQLTAADFERMTHHPENYHSRMKQLIERHPEEAVPRIRYARTLLELGQAEAAQLWLVPLETHEERNADYHLIAAQVALKLADANSAVIHCKQLTQLQPNSAAHQQLLGDAYLLQNEPLSAASAYERAWQIEPANGLAFTAMIQTQLRLQKHAMAQRAILRASKQPTGLDAQTLASAAATVAEAQLEAGQSAEAEQLLEQLPKLTLTTPRLLALRIELLIASNAAAEAERLLSLLRQIEQEGPYSHFAQARLLQQRGRQAEAIAELQQSLARVPLPRAHLALLDLLLERNAYTEAEAQATAWQHQHPDDASNLQRLARLSQHNGNSEQAIAQYQALLKLQPGQIDAMANLIRLLEPSDPALALGYAKQAYLLKPGSAEISGLYGWLLLRTRQSPDQAQRLLLSAHQSQTDDSEILYHLAQAELALERKAEAIKHLRVLAERENDPYREQAGALLDSLAWRPSQPN